MLVAMHVHLEVWADFTEIIGSYMRGDAWHPN